ncbi:HVO_0758 family zinc finger protein [Halobaculum sp. MBLA0143]|uniref:HVO_0758 family zinc finger protein n=1 Tax=Halobaculum sp. MBLA0143 TaxID=3079933 RepID=UPI00352485F3
MESVRKGLRRGDLAKDNYERLQCANCDENLKTENDPDEVFTRRVCPECGGEWKEIG